MEGEPSLKTVDFLFDANFLILKYSWFIMSCQSLLYSRVSQLYMYIYYFLILFSIMVYPRILNIVPCAVY